MLLRFSVSNYLSIRDEQELSMVATSLKDREDGLVDVAGMAKTRVLPAAIIFGPNASGKSSLLMALKFMHHQVITSHRKGGPETKIERHPFALSAGWKSKPTKLNVDFIVEDVRYNYGFCATDTAFVEEWLYAFPHGTRRKLFTRSGALDIQFGSTLKGQRNVIKELMRPNSLYLSVAAQNGHQELTKVSKYFLDLKFGGNLTEPSGLTGVADIFEYEESFDDRAIHFLKIINSGVTDFRFENFEFDKEYLPKLLESVGSIAKIEDQNFDVADFEKFLNRKKFKIQLGHKNDNGSIEYFPLGMESTGTIRLLEILKQCFSAIDNGTMVIIDEIDISLHTQVCEAIVYLFTDKKINTHGAQLIATTHDTNLLRSEFLRRDQLWLIEKNEYGATDLFSLADIKTRGSDNYELGYLQGRYGAVPFTGPVSDLFATH